MSRIIVITSGKGGVGKTTTAINLGAALKYFGEDVLVVDANLSTPNIGVYLGAPEVPISLNHVLMKKAKLHEAIYEHDSGIKILPSSLSIKNIKKTKLGKIKALREELLNYAEYVVVDSSAGLGKESTTVLEIADEVIVVTNPELPAITDALRAIKISSQLKKPIRGVLVTKVKGKKTEMDSDSVKEMLEEPIIGRIPHDEAVEEARVLKHPVVHTHPKSKAARAYKEIAAKLLGVKYDSRKDREKFIERFLKIFKSKKF